MGTSSSGVGFRGQVFRGRWAQDWQEEIDRAADEEAALLNGDAVSETSSMANFEIEEEDRPAADSCCKKAVEMAGRCCVALADWAGTAMVSSVGSVMGVYGSVVNFGGDLGALEEDGKNLLENRLLVSVGVGAATGALVGRVVAGRENSALGAATAGVVGAFAAGITFVSWMWAAPFSDHYY